MFMDRNNKGKSVRLRLRHLNEGILTGKTRGLEKTKKVEVILKKKFAKNVAV